MALSATNSNFISRGRSNSNTLLDLRSNLEIELGKWNLDNMFNTLTDEDIASEFPGLTKGAVVGYINAIKGVLIALGTNQSGDPVHDDVSSNAANLIKMLE